MFSKSVLFFQELVNLILRFTITIRIITIRIISKPDINFFKIIIKGIKFFAVLLATKIFSAVPINFMDLS